MEDHEYGDEQDQCHECGEWFDAEIYAHCPYCREGAPC